MEAPPSKRPISDDEQGPNKETRIEVQTFPMYPLSKYNGNCAVYKQPIEIQSYSIDHERTVHFDDRQLVRTLLIVRNYEIQLMLTALCDCSFCRNII